MSEKPDSATEETAVRDELLSLEALLIGRLYLYTLFHKALGGEPTPQLLEALSSQATGDAIEEYALTDETMAKLKTFLGATANKEADANWLESVAREYTRFFEGPADLPAYPWEAPYISHESTLFQKSTLEVREAYRAYGFKVKLYQRVPDDHVSTMFVFMARLAERSLEAFRNGSLDGFRTLMVDQHTFARAHLNNWLPKYASLARSVKEAHLYPQLVQGAKAFARLDETFSAEAIAWVDGSTEEVALFLQSGTFVRPEAFDEMERAIEHMAALELVGLDENELVEM